MTKEKVNNDLLTRLMTADAEVKDFYEVERLGLKIELKALRANEVNELRVASTYPDPKRAGRKVVNEEEFNQAVMEKAIVGPAELYDESLRKHYGAKNVGDVLDAILLVGELGGLQRKMQEINGISTTDIEDAKN